MCNSASQVRTDISGTDSDLEFSGTFPTGQKLTIKVRGESVVQGPQGFAVYAWNVKPNS